MPTMESLYSTMPKRATRGTHRQTPATSQAGPAQYGLPNAAMGQGVGPRGYMQPAGDPYAGQGLRYGAQPQMGGPAVGTLGRRPMARPMAALGGPGIPVDQMNLPEGFAGRYPNVTAGLAGQGYVHTPPPPAQGSVYATGLQGARGTPGQGLMTNEQAQQFAGLSPQGYMPNITVGGAFGQRIGEKQRFNAATNRYEGSMLGAGGYQNPQAMAATQFGGLTPRMGTSPSGAPRMGFYDGPAQPAAQGMGWGGAVAAAVARNPALSVTDTGGLMGSPASPGRSPGLSSGELGANRQAYVQRRNNELADRQSAVEANAAGRQDARRQRLGNYTMEERQQFGIPGFAVAQQQAGAMRDVAKADADARMGVADLQAGAMRDVAGINAAGQEKLIASQEKIAEGNQRMQEGIATGNQKAILEGQRMVAEAEKERTRVLGEGQKGLQGIKERELAQNAQQWKDKFGLEKQGQDLERGEFYRQKAAEARANKDFAKYQEYSAMADQFMGAGAPQGAPGAPQGAPPGLPNAGGPVNASTLFPDYQERLAIQQAGPEALIQSLRAMTKPDGSPLSQQEADAVIKEMFPDTTVSMYDQGGFGLENVWGAAGGGGENLNRLGWAVSGRGPKPPMIPGTGIPMPVIPGALGVAQTYLGW